MPRAVPLSSATKLGLGAQIVVVRKEEDIWSLDQIRADRLVIEAHGENNPLLRESDEYAWQMNRCVEFIPARD